MTRIQTLGAVLGFLVCLFTNSARADLIQSTGKVSFLRVHDVGTGFGPPSDFIDVEVVIQLNTKPGESYGFQLRNDANRAARQGMLDLLRDAFNSNRTVSVDYNITPPKKNGVIVRVALISGEPVPPPALVIVPDVRGQPLATARQILFAVGFTAPTSNVVDCDNIGSVSTQNPNAGTHAAAGSAVQLRIGQKPQPPRVCQ
jgi:PASTA domain